MGVAEAIRRFASRGVLVDTNLLVLHVVGSVDRSLVDTHRRTANCGFGSVEFDLLELLLEQFHVRVTTPHVLTEVSNLVSQAGEPHRSLFMQRLAEDVARVDEVFERAAELAGDEFFVPVGMADTSLTRAAADRFLVLTDDYRLANRLTLRNVAAVNFNHVRQWFLA